MYNATGDLILGQTFVPYRFHLSKVFGFLLWYGLRARRVALSMQFGNDCPTSARDYFKILQIGLQTIGDLVLLCTRLERGSLEA